MFPNTVKNTAIVLMNNRGFVLMLKCRFTQRWMTPGGKIELGESPFMGMLREFREETGYCLPQSRILKTVNWPRKNPRTRIYVAVSDEPLPKFKETEEVVERRLVHWSDIMNMNREEIRHNVKRSFFELGLDNLVKSRIPEAFTK